MGKHQIIYTSCKRGISGVSDGMQIYSHDSAFNKGGTDGVKGLFTYQTPNLPIGVVMTEELAETMPRIFLYRRLDDDYCAVALNTYLGRDYMGSSGRFGNHLSHAIICDDANFTIYPCELYGSNSLLTKAPDGVKLADVPSFLPEPTLSNGGLIYPESISDFLVAHDRMESYKKMLASMLMYKSARKRVVICDSPENIIMWIAALHYALPLKLALTVNFATYDHDPSLSASRICGVLPEGTKYSPGNASNHFTFDFINDIMPDVAAEGDFYDFIDMGMALSYDSIRDFHEFVSTKLTYSNADEQYYQIYSLYCLLTDGLENMPFETFKKAVQMAYDYAIDKKQSELVEKLLASRDFVLASSDTYTIEVIKVLVNNFSGVSRETQEEIKSLFADKIISFFAEHSANESEFKRLYSEVESIGSTKGIEVPAELIKDNNSNKLLSTMRIFPNQWQMNFVAEKLCGYITEKGISIDASFANHPVNKLLGDIIALGISKNADDAFSLITKCLQRFSSNWNQFICMALGIESSLQNSSNSKAIIDKLWTYVVQFIANKHSANKQNIYAFLLTHKLYGQVIGLYREWMASAGSQETAKSLLQEQLGIHDAQYIHTYSEEICVCYYNFILKLNKANTLNEEKELLELILQRNIPFGLIDRLAESVLSDVPIVASSEKHQELIKSITIYYRSQNKTHYTGRLLILVAGMVLSRGMHGKVLEAVARDIKTSAGEKAINLTSLTPKEVEKYIDWIVPSLFKSCKTPKDLLSAYNLFGHTVESTNGFITLCAKEALKEIKDRNSALGVYLFLELLFSIGSDDDRIEAGKMLQKLNKPTLDNINTFATNKFVGRDDCLVKLGEVYGIATKTIPAPKKGFFFRKK